MQEIFLVLATHFDLMIVAMSGVGSRKIALQKSSALTGIQLK